MKTFKFFVRSLSVFALFLSMLLILVGYFMFWIWAFRKLPLPTDLATSFGVVIGVLVPLSAIVAGNMKS
ncbi:hypothetical protein [Companilactobacillus sp.]|uniref:hypothetical protein n=1 Tax=Companilactobacillus sp. TaxID=2767905 RepID=UPI002607FEAA|nr:hypothetical protein [Companilactobacillus sp.]